MGPATGVDTDSRRRGGHPLGPEQVLPPRGLRGLQAAATAEEAIALAEKSYFAAAVLDVRLGRQGPRAAELLSELRSRDPDLCGRHGHGLRQRRVGRARDEGRRLGLHPQAHRQRAPPRGGPAEHRARAPAPRQRLPAPRAHRQRLLARHRHPRPALPLPHRAGGQGQGQRGHRPPHRRERARARRSWPATSTSPAAAATSPSSASTAPPSRRASSSPSSSATRRAPSPGRSSGGSASSSSPIAAPSSSTRWATCPPRSSPSSSASSRSRASSGSAGPSGSRSTSASSPRPTRTWASSSGAANSGATSTTASTSSTCGCLPCASGGATSPSSWTTSSRSTRASTTGPCRGRLAGGRRALVGARLAGQRARAPERGQPGGPPLPRPDDRPRHPRRRPGADRLPRRGAPTAGRGPDAGLSSFTTLKALRDEVTARYERQPHRGRPRAERRQQVEDGGRARRHAQDPGREDGAVRPVLKNRVRKIETRRHGDTETRR